MRMTRADQPDRETLGTGGYLRDRYQSSVVMQVLQDEW